MHNDINVRTKERIDPEERIVFEFICRKGQEYKLFLVGTAFWMHWSDGSQWFPLVNSPRRLLTWSYRVLMDVRLRTWSGFCVQAETGQLQKVQVSRYLSLQVRKHMWGQSPSLPTIALFPRSIQNSLPLPLGHFPFHPFLGSILLALAISPDLASTWRHYLK